MRDGAERVQCGVRIGLERSDKCDDERGNEDKREEHEHGITQDTTGHHLGAAGFHLVRSSLMNVRWSTVKNMIKQNNRNATAAPAPKLLSWKLT